MVSDARSRRPYSLARAVLILAAAGIYARSAAARARGDPINEPALARRTDILYFLSFDDESRTRSWHRGGKGYGWTNAKENVVFGAGALEVTHTAGTHYPMEIHPDIDEVDRVHVRWYRKWEEGYDFTQHKMPGVYARAGGRRTSGAGIKPTGRDKYSCKLYISFDRMPHFYSYKPDQRGPYGWSPGVNKGSARPMEAGRWYCFEMMIKANTPPAHDGELKMWIDGRLVAHYTDLFYRDVSDLRINQFTYSAYVGGTWTSKRDQKLWDDQIVVAREYIGPIVVKTRPASKKEPLSLGPPRRADPLSSFAEQLAPIRRRARAAEFASAVELCTELLVASMDADGFQSLRAFAEGLAAGAELKDVVIARAARVRPTVYIDMGASPQRVTLVGADANGVRVEASGNAMPIGWRGVSPRRFHGIAAKLVDDASASHLALARYCATMGLRDEAREELRRVGADLAEEAKRVRALVE
jgi:hypothetical protein